MKTVDVVRFSFHSIERAPARTALMLLAMAIGVAAVLILTGLGEAARRYVIDEFASLGTNLIIVLPGKSETTGGTLGASFGGTTRDLTTLRRCIDTCPGTIKCQPVITAFHRVADQFAFG